MFHLLWHKHQFHLQISRCSIKETIKAAATAAAAAACSDEASSNFTLISPESEKNKTKTKPHNKFCVGA